MQTREIIDRIFAGETVCPAIIRMHNAEKVMAWVRNTDRHHTAETCRSTKRKDCVHAPGPHTADFAATLASEAVNACTCGEHGTNDPDAVAAIGAAFIERWN